MFNRANEIKERLEQFRKSDSAILKTIAKRQERLDAGQNALRVRAVEQALPRGRSIAMGCNPPLK